MSNSLMMSVPEVASALGVDSNTVRVFIQAGIFTWGKCFKKPGNDKLTYVIMRKDFEEATGYAK